MGKRSAFARRPMDDYPTIDPKAVEALLPFLDVGETFAEPCCGEGHLIDQLCAVGLTCVWGSDIADGTDALDLESCGNPDLIITNPPWSRDILHKLIVHFQRIAPTWLLFDADWAHTKQASPFLKNCSHIVSVGRLKWIPHSPHTGKDNCAWYHFDKFHRLETQFIGRRITEEAA